MPASPRVSPYRRMPLWLQWGIPGFVAVALIIALVLFVQHQTSSAPGVAVVSGSRLKNEEGEARATIRQVQSPHTAPVAAGVAPAVAMQRAVTGFVARQVSRGRVNGPLQSVHCAVVGGGISGSRVPLTCTVVSAHVNYRYLGVVTPASHLATFCQKVLYPPVYGEKPLAVSARCT